MKKIYVTMFMAALCSGASLFAQDAPAKKYFLGGSAGFSSSKEESANNMSPVGTPPVYSISKFSGSTFTISPEFGFYIRPNTALGIKLAYGHSGGSYTTSNFYSASPFVRFIIPIGKGLFSVYNDLGISARYMKGGAIIGTGVYAEGIAKAIVLGAFYEPGLQFRLKSNINLMATLGDLFYYSYYREKAKAQSDPSVQTNDIRHTLGINKNFLALNSFRLGVNLLF